MRDVLHWYGMVYKMCCLKMVWYTRCVAWVWYGLRDVLLKNGMQDVLNWYGMVYEMCCLRMVCIVLEIVKSFLAQYRR